MPDFQHSAGGLVVRNTEEVLLISTQNGSRWQLPKGHVEGEETPEQTAVREIQEETGVTGRVLEAIGMVEYDFKSHHGRPIRKRVDYFLLDYESGTTRDFDPSEVSGARWFAWSEALERLTFDNERALVQSTFLRNFEAELP